jgi:hypothetical protein
MADTLLQIIGMGVPLYSGRGVQQTLVPIEAAKVLRRSVNGQLIDLSLTQFRKYKTTIRCTDQYSPSLDSIWPGREVTIYCVVELVAPTSGFAAARPVVSGSQYDDGNGWTHYRPSLDVRITNYSTQNDEWPADVQWEIEAEEI